MTNISTNNSIPIAQIYKQLSLQSLCHTDRTVEPLTTLSKGINSGHEIFSTSAQKLPTGNFINLTHQFSSQSLDQSSLLLRSIPNYQDMQIAKSFNQYFRSQMSPLAKSRSPQNSPLSKKKRNMHSLIQNNQTKRYLSLDTSRQSSMLNISPRELDKELPRPSLLPKILTRTEKQLGNEIAADDQQQPPQQLPQLQKRYLSMERLDNNPYMLNEGNGSSRTNNNNKSLNQNSAYKQQKRNFWSPTKKFSSQNYQQQQPAIAQQPFNWKDNDYSSQKLQVIESNLPSILDLQKIYPNFASTKSKSKGGLQALGQMQAQGGNQKIIMADSYYNQQVQDQLTRGTFFSAMQNQQRQQPQQSQLRQPLTLQPPQQRHQHTKKLERKCQDQQQQQLLNSTSHNKKFIQSSEGSYVLDALNSTGAIGNGGLSQQQQQFISTGYGGVKDDEYKGDSTKTIFTVKQEFQQLFQETMELLQNDEALKVQLKLQGIGFELVIKYFKLFVDFIVLQNSAVRAEMFLPLKVNQQTFNLLLTQFKAVLKTNQFVIEVIEEIMKQMQQNSYYLKHSTVFDEIGGSSGLHQIIVLVLQHFKTLVQNTEILNIHLNVFANKFLRNLTFTLSDNEAGIDYEQMHCSHARLSPNYEDFYICKLLFWEALDQLNVHRPTILNFLIKLEQFRYEVDIQQFIDQQFGNPELRKQLSDKLFWNVASDKEILALFNEDIQMLSNFCQTLLQVLVYRRLSLSGGSTPFSSAVASKEGSVKPEEQIFTRQVRFTSEQYDKVSKIFCDTIRSYNFGESFVRSIEVKFIKLKYRIGLEQSVYDMLGGYEGIRNFVKQIGELHKNSDIFLMYLKQFPEEKRHFSFCEPGQTCGLNSGSGATQVFNKSGLKMFMFFLISYLSKYDCYGSNDVQAGIQVFQIARTVPVQWKQAVDKVLKNMGFDVTTVKKISNHIFFEFLHIYQPEESSYFRAALLN